MNSTGVPEEMLLEWRYMKELSGFSQAECFIVVGVVLMRK